MAQVVRDGLLACIDCTMAISNDDYTGMDDDKEASVRAGITRLSKIGYPVVGEGLGFKWQGCDCCRDGLGGDKYELSILD